MKETKKILEEEIVFLKQIIAALVQKLGGEVKIKMEEYKMPGKLTGNLGLNDDIFLKLTEN